VESGKNEIVAQSVHSAAEGERVGVAVEPDNIHIMLAEDHTNIFQAEINKNYELEYNGTTLDVRLTDLVRGSRLDADGTVLDANGLELDRMKLRILVSIQPQDIRMTDVTSEGLVEGYISNLIYKGDHYSYVIHTDLEQDFVVDDEYLWNMEDQVGLIMPEKKMTFTVKR
jgi:spermidine/putrescine transport system ATP-binding protein